MRINLLHSLKTALQDDSKIENNQKSTYKSAAFTSLHKRIKVNRHLVIKYVKFTLLSSS